MAASQSTLLLSTLPEGCCRFKVRRRTIDELRSICAFTICKIPGRFRFHHRFMQRIYQKRKSKSGSGSGKNTGSEMSDLKKSKQTEVGSGSKASGVRFEGLETDGIDSRPIKLKPMLVVEHFLIWGFPFLLVIIGLSTEHLGYSGSDAWCTVHANDPASFSRTSSGIETTGGTDIDYWNLFMISVPLAFITGVGTIIATIMLVALSAFLLYANCPCGGSGGGGGGGGGISSRSSSLGSSTPRGNSETKSDTKLGSRCLDVLRQLRTLISLQWRVVVYVLLMIIVFSVMLSFRVVFDVQKADMLDELAKTMRCTFQEISNSFLEPPGSITQATTKATCKPEDKISYGLWVIHAILYAGWPIPLLCIFGCRRQLPKVLKRRAKTLTGSATKGSETTMITESNGQIPNVPIDRYMNDEEDSELDGSSSTGNILEEILDKEEEIEELSSSNIEETTTSSSSDIEELSSSDIEETTTTSEDDESESDEVLASNSDSDTISSASV